MADPASFPLQEHDALLLKNPLQHPLKFLYIQCLFLHPSQLLCKFCNWIYSLRSVLGSLICIKVPLTFPLVSTCGPKVK